MRPKALPVLTPATALALPPVLLAFATALAEAELELPRQLFTVGSVATAAEKAPAVPELCASEAASAHTRPDILNHTWNRTHLANYLWGCLHELPRQPHTKNVSKLITGGNRAYSCQRGCSGLLRFRREEVLGGKGQTCKGRLHSWAAVLCDGGSVGGHQGWRQTWLTECLGGGHSQRIRIHCTHHSLL